MSGELTDKHRLFYLDDELTYAFFFDPAVTDKKKILEDFFNCRDWKWHVDYFKVKVASAIVSDDLKEVRIKSKQGSA